MSTFSTTIKNAILNHVVGNVVASYAATYTVWLTTTIPTQAVPGLEVTGPGYARLTVANNKTTFSNAALGVVSNAIAFAFPTAVGSWGIVRGVEIYDGATRIAFAEVTPPKSITAGNVATFSPGNLIFQLAGI